eukprot:8665575-Heterocapsa_arctica.AAC.1
MLRASAQAGRSRSGAQTTGRASPSPGFHDVMGSVRHKRGDSTGEGIEALPVYLPTNTAAARAQWSALPV